MLIDKPAIARLIPHAGAMCLLDGVLSWTDMRIRCATTSHLAVDNPLRRDGRLGIVCGAEYAAQAMALHGSLADGGAAPARAGYLASLRSVAIHAERLDLLPGTLFVEADRLDENANGAVYRFALIHDDRILLSGRAAVSLAVA